MRLTFRSKLLIIVGATTVAFALLIVVSTLIGLRERRHLALLQDQLVPRLELGPQLEAQFARLQRGLQDASSAQDAEVLEQAATIHARLIERLRAPTSALDPAAASAAADAIERYYRPGLDVARRMMAGETGENLVEAITDLQTRHSEAAAALERATRLDRAQVSAAFAAAASARGDAARMQLLIGLGSLAFVLGLTIWLSGGVLRSVHELKVGLQRFGQGDFRQPVPVTSTDELGAVAETANQMAGSLRTLSEHRDRSEWLTRGQAGLALELRGEQEPEDIAGRAVRYLAGYLEAPAGALYRVADDGGLRLLGQYALGATADGIPATFRPGEGLLGQASQGEQLVVIDDPPASYLRVRSALGEAAPRALLLVPLVHSGKVRGVMELALFKPASEVIREFLRSVSETLAIALEVAHARVAMRTLLEETRRQAERLRVQEEQLRASNEELTAQQEELREANEELEHQRRTLEGQNAALEDTRQRLEQKAEARANWSGSGDAATETVWYEIKDANGATEFLGYETERAEGVVQALVVGGKQITEANAGDKVQVVVNQTPFYGESGGQMGDTGVIVFEGGRAIVTDTQKKGDGIFVHSAEITEGKLKGGDPVTLEVDHARRGRIRSNHSATHLIHEALREVLGTHVAQKGSLVAPERLRFDVSHPKPMSAEELKEVEEIANDIVVQNAAVSTRLMSVDDAIAEGAMALFGEKYGDEVRVVSMGTAKRGAKSGKPYSVELCGGTHVRETGDIGLIRILSDSAVGAGVRRIEALTGQAAREYLSTQDERVKQLATILKVQPDDVLSRVEGLMDERRKLERELADTKKKLAMGGGGSAAEQGVREVNGVKFFGRVITGVEPRDLKGLADEGKKTAGSGIVTLIGVSEDGKASAVVAVTDDLTGRFSAVDLVRVASQALGGKGGGGRPDMAQAGGPDGAKADEALEAVAAALG